MHNGSAALRILFWATAGALIVGCAGSSTVVADGGSRARSAMVSASANRLNDVSSIEMFFPNYVTKVGDRHITASDRVLRGKIIEVEEGRAYKGPEESDKPVELDAYGDPSAMWRSVYLTIDVDEVIAGEQESVDPIRVGLTLQGGPINIDDVFGSLKSIGEVVVFVDDLPFGVDGRDDVVHLAMAGASTLAVHEDGLLSLPLYTENVAGMTDLKEVPASGAVPASADLDELRRIAAAPPVIVDLGTDR